MPSSEDIGERKLSRRRFVESAGALAAAGVVGMGLGETAVDLLGQRSAKVTAHLAEETGSSRMSTEMETASRSGTNVPLSRGDSKSHPASPVGPMLTAANTFSIFWITDTQFLSESNPALFRMVTNWIVSNWGRFNGKLVIHTGDIVQHGLTQAEWAAANEAMSILLNNGIPYTWCAGNHDDAANGDPTSGWIGNMVAPAFDPATVSAQVNSLQNVSWAGDYHDGMNTAVAFSASGLNFLVVNIEWNAEPDALEWVKGLLDNPKYENYRVIIAPHAYTDFAGNLDDAKWGPILAGFVGGLTPLMDSHSSSVFLTLNGHFATDCGFNTPVPINRRNQLMFDRQDSLDVPKEPTGRGADNASMTTNDSDLVGGATVTVLTFDTLSNTIGVRTYDVYAGELRTGPYDQYTVDMIPTSVAISSGGASGLNDSVVATIQS
jgi:hypothetical protein